MIIQKKAEIFSFLIILFFIIGLILLSWFIGDRQYVEVSVVYHQATENSASQDFPAFDRQDDEDNYFLAYGWTDFSGHALDISFPLSKSLVNEAEREFGYFEADLRKHMDDSMERSKEEMIVHLKEFVEGLIRKSKYPEYILIEKVAAKSFNLKLSVPPSLHKKVKREFDKIKAKLNRLFNELRTPIKHSGTENTTYQKGYNQAIIDIQNNVNSMDFREMILIEHEDTEHRPLMKEIERLEKNMETTIGITKDIKNIYKKGFITSVTGEK